DHKAGGTHQLTGNQRGVAHTAAQVEHPHAFRDACRPQQILSQVAEKPPAFQGAETRRWNSQRVDLTPLRTAFLAVVFEKASLHCFSLRTREQKVRPWPDPGSL